MKLGNRAMGRIALGAAVFAVGGAVLFATTRGGQQSGGVTAGDQVGGTIRANYHRFLVAHAQSWPWSGGETQTVVKVINDSDSSVDCIVDWIQFSGSSTGTSSGSIPPHESRLFSTANSGETIPPFSVFSGTHIGRDLTGSFYGHAKVYIGPNSGSAKNVAVTAFLLNRIGDGYAGSGLGNAASVTTLQVMRSDDADGDGTIDTRFKGD